MIGNNIKYGDITIPTYAEFGKGDILVMHGKNIDHVVAMFKNSTEAREIGEEAEFVKGDTSTTVNPEIIFIFDNENSIDVVIDQLQKAKDLLHDILTAQS